MRSREELPRKVKTKSRRWFSEKASRVKSGLVSVTFRRLPAAEVVRLAAEAGLVGIEWGGDVHVPHGDLAAAAEIGRLTREAGCEVAGYGSYYKLGVSEKRGLPFARVLATAEALGAPRLRVWAGDRNSEKTSAEQRRRIVEEAMRLAETAAPSDVGIVLEFHADTLTDTAASTRALLAEIGHSNVRTGWQPVHNEGADVNCAGLESIGPWLEGAHVFHWWPTANERRSLCEGAGDWARYLALIRKWRPDCFASLEFVRGDSIEQFRSDARTLLNLLEAR